MGPRHSRAVEWFKKKMRDFSSCQITWRRKSKGIAKLYFDSEVVLVFFKGWLVRLVSDD